jgi:hypothetical protein
VARAGKQAGNERQRTRRAMFGAGIPALAMAAVAVAAGACNSSTPSSTATKPSHSTAVTKTKSTPTTSTSTPVTTPPTVPPTTVATPPLKLDTAVVKAARSGKNAYTVACDYPVLTGSSNAKAVASVNATIYAGVSTQVDNFIGYSNKGPLSTFEPTTAQLTCTWSKVWLSPTLGSISMTVRDYPAGAAHPFSPVITFNFDPSTGQFYALADLFRSGSAWLQALSHESASLLPSAVGPGGSSLVFDSGIGPVASNFSAFTMTPAELSITFQDYQVGPYVIGEPTVHIPQSALSAVVNPAGPLM